MRVFTRRSLQLIKSKIQQKFSSKRIKFGLCLSTAVSLLLYKKYHENYRLKWADKGWNIVCESMLKVQYAIIGSGAAAWHSAQVILHKDKNAKVVIIFEKLSMPFSFDNSTSNAFCKENLLRAVNGGEHEIEEMLCFSPLPNMKYGFEDLDSGEGYSTFVIGLDVESIDSDSHLITMDNSYKIQYDKLIIATETQPIKHTILENSNISDDNLIVVDSLTKYKKIIEIIKEGNKSITIVGTCPGAYSLSTSLSSFEDKNFKVSFVIENNNDSIVNTLPPHIVENLIKAISQNNVPVIQDGISSCKMNGDKVHLEFQGSSPVESDIVILFNKKKFDDGYIEGKKCFGSKCPQRHSAFSSGYYVDTNLHAAGDEIIAAGANVVYKEPNDMGYFQADNIVHEIVSGKVAGRVALGENRAFDYPYLNTYALSDDIKVCTIGTASPFVQTLSIWKDCEDSTNPVFGKGVIFYHKHGNIIGITLWNLFSKLELCEEIINKSSKISDAKEIVKWIIPQHETIEEYNLFQ